MHINVRRSLAAFFVLVFVLGFLPLIFITSGSLYNPKKGELEKTTLLILESEPRGATILLNGKAPESWWSPYLPLLENRAYTTPGRLHYLIPDTYELSVTKNNYIPWNTTIALVGDQSTIIDNIKLWPLQLTGPLLQEGARTISISPKGAYIAYTVDDGAKLFSIIDASVQPLPFNIDSITELWWGPDENALLAKSQDTFEYLNLADGHTQVIPFSTAINTILWDRSNPEFLFGVNNETIETYSLTTANLEEKKNTCNG